MKRMKITTTKKGKKEMRKKKISADKNASVMLFM